MKKILLTILAVLALGGMAMAQTAPSDINLHRNDDGTWSFIMPGRNLVMSTETFSTNDTVNGHYLAGVPEGWLILVLGDTVPVSNDSLRRTTPITEGTPVTIVPTGNLRRIKSITLVDEAPAGPTPITLAAKLAYTGGEIADLTDATGDLTTLAWAVGEHIAILYEVEGTKKVADAEITAVDATTGEATIEFTVEAGTPDDTPCTLVYPLSAAKDDHTGVKDAATLLAAQDGTLNANLDVRVGEGTIQTTTPGLTVTTQPAATLVSDIAILKIGSISDGSSNVTSSVTALTVSNGASTVTVSRAAGAGPIYVAVPAVTSGNLVFTAAYGSTFLVKSVSQTLDAGHLYPVNLTMFPGALPGKFSVSASKKIYFSQGNLKYDGSNWSFHANQYDRVFTNEGTATSYPMDLFTWGNQATTNYNGTGYVSGTSDLSGSTDWGNNMGAGWYTMTIAEWQYIFNTRASGSTVNSTSNARYTHATINTDGTGVNGMILFPDGVTIEASEATSWGTVNGNSSWGTKCTTAQWTALEAKGCVFLPAAGVRHYDASVSYVGRHGGYWSSTVYDDNNAYVVIFESFFLYAGYSRTRNSGYSVRLVYNAN